MKPNGAIESFRERIRKLMENVEPKDPKRDTDIPSAGKRKHEHEPYQELVDRIQAKVIEPRIAVMVDAIGKATLDVAANVGYVRFTVPSKERHALTYLLFCLVHDPSGNKVNLYTESCLRPLTQACRRPFVLPININQPDMTQVTVFVEDRMVEFLSTYLIFKNRHDKITEAGKYA